MYSENLSVVPLWNLSMVPLWNLLVVPLWNLLVVPLWNLSVVPLWCAVYGKQVQQCGFMMFNKALASFCRRPQGSRWHQAPFHPLRHHHLYFIDLIGSFWIFPFSPLNTLISRLLTNPFLQKALQRLLLFNHCRLQKWGF